jgi:putative transposase
MPYPSDLTDEQWDLIKPDIVRRKRRGPKSNVDLRGVVNAMFYRLRTGCQWRYLPLEYEGHDVVRGYWRRWQRNGLWERLNTRLREAIRVREGRNPQPTAAIIDSQSVKTVQKGGTAASTRASWSRAASATSSSIPWACC